MARRRRSREEWSRLVAEWRASGLSQPAFAREKGLAPTTLSWWACRLKREARSEPRLVAVDVAAEEPPAPFRVELSGGRTVVVPAGFDAASLRRLVAALEERPC